MTGTPKRQHLVSKFYLKMFANEGGLLHCFDRLAAQRKSLSVENATVEIDFNTLKANNLPEDPYQVEIWYSAIESRASQAIRRIVEERQFPPTPDDRHAISMWISVEFWRTRYARVMAQDFLDYCSEMESARPEDVPMRDWFRDQVTNNPPEWTRRSAFRYRRKNISADASDFHTNVSRFSVEQSASSVSKRFWVLAERPENDLLTCDAPLSYLDWSLRPLDPDLRVPAPVAYLPLSPSTALLMLNSKSVSPEVIQPRMDGMLATMLTCATIIWSERWLFSCNEDHNVFAALESNFESLYELIQGLTSPP